MSCMFQRLAEWVTEVDEETVLYIDAKNPVRTEYQINLCLVRVYLFGNDFELNLGLHQ